MATDKIDATQIIAGKKFKITERTTAKIIFNIHNIKASTCKTPAQIIENNAVFGYGSEWRVLNIENGICKLQEIGTPLQRSMTMKSLEHLLKAQE